MAQNFAGTPDSITFTLGASNVATRIDPPNNCRRLTVFFETDAGKLAFKGTDAVAIDASAIPVDADRWFQVYADQDQREGGKGPAPIYIATATGGTTVYVVAEAG
jgi:hypothetical protein